MDKIKELRALIAKKRDEARALHEEHSESWGDEHQAKFDAIMAEVDSAQAALDREYQINGLTDPSDQVEALLNQAAERVGRIDVEDKPVYANIGEQLLDVRSMTLDDREAPKARDRFQKMTNRMGLETGKDSEGGYVVETDKSQTILQTAYETGQFTSRASEQPIGANADSFEYYAFDDRDKSSGKILGGIEVFRKGEVEEMNQWSTAKMTVRDLRVEDSYALLKVSDRMLRDATALTGLVRSQVPNAFALKFDSELFEGDGVGKPLGIMKSGLLVTVAKKANQTADTVVVENLVNMMARFSGDMNRACWFMNRDVFPQLPLLTIGNQPVYLPGGNLTGSPFGTVMGMPIVFSEHNETLGDKGDIMLADWGYYLLVTKGQVEEAESMHVRFLTHEMVYRFTARNNGQPFHNTPITPRKGSNNLSPFVTLAERT